MTAPLLHPIERIPQPTMASRDSHRGSGDRATVIAHWLQAKDEEFVRMLWANQQGKEGFDVVKTLLAGLKPATVAAGGAPPPATPSTAARADALVSAHADQLVDRIVQPVDRETAPRGPRPLALPVQLWRDRRRVTDDGDLRRLLRHPGPRTLAARFLRQGDVVRGIVSGRSPNALLVHLVSLL